MIRRIIVRTNQYYDSVFLMQVARRMAAEPGIRDASAVLGTDANKKLLAEAGYGGTSPAEVAAAGPNDLVIALEGEEQAVAAGGAPAGAPAAVVHSIREAVARRPDSSVAVISVPGEHAAREARLALAEGLNVFLFSSNVSVEDELFLKTEARGKGLIVMGPDCGTAYVGGAGIGFANAVRRGPFGIIGSTGTGMQELSCLLHQAGSGVSHGIGTGSRDLSDAIGGISTMTAFDALESDPDTRVILVLSKPPGPAASARLLDRASRCGKPVVICLLGSAGTAAVANVQVAITIDELVDLALKAVGAKRLSDPAARSEWAAMVEAEAERVSPSQRYVRGLFAGGTFCYQAQAIFRSAGIVASSNSPLDGMRELADPNRSQGHSLVDMGAEVFVEGRPHPMIDATLRRRRLAQETADPAVAVILLDFILGAISSRDPVGDLVATIRQSIESVRQRGGNLCAVASVCGTNEDAQDLRRQRSALETAGVRVFPSAARAAAFCAEVALRLGQRTEAV